MRTLMSISLLFSISHALNNAYLPANSDYAPKRPLATEYFTYAAPPDEDQAAPWQAARQLAKALVPPQQVVFIRTPETNIFTLTAKQLASQNPLDIYVLQRQADTAALAQQQAAIQQQAEHKPSVHFVKYRTPADVTRALASLRSGYDQLPGNSISHAIETADVFEVKPQLQTLSQPVIPQTVRPPVPQTIRQPEPVIFKILPKGGSDYEVHEEATELEMARLQALFREYLPPGKHR
ncbi:uncharacterized protein LOC108153963 [Drosophila miranda]|uniref:uncharacterized protein LOC108153963 n=1 Tax=Drosophila miranda TaxID=7229 RepID=UPI00143F853B|nr:uncharacterized protein LOC108153963 [Drosophila miranda]